MGIGAKVYIKTANTTQFQEQYTNRGFQSSVDPVMHIGLGADSIVLSVKVTWPGGKSSLATNIKTGTLLEMDERTATLADAKIAPAIKPMFIHVTENLGINFAHQQSTSVDFKISPLLPFQLSKIGPCMAKADVNGDGLEDLFLGASAGQESQLYLQAKNGSFILSKSQPWNNDKAITNSDALFFDADGDGDADLYPVSGGADYPLNSNNYQDRIFENDGRGNFKKPENAIPAETISGGCARASDIDRNGLPDLFVDVRFNPGMYPTRPESYILKNKSKAGKIIFEKDLLQADSVLAHPGMVTDAIWADLNKDGWEDLVIAGHFIPVSIFENHKGVLVNQTNVYGLSHTNGWWNRILAADFDNDGDHSDFWEIERFTATPSTYQLRPTWAWAYEQVGRSNNAIIYVPKVPVMDETIRKRSLGEAYFLRAHGYWQLNLIFGEVPLILEENVLTGNYNIPKSTVDEVRLQMESDLLKAIDLLPETYGALDKGRVNRGAALGLLSKLYLLWDKLDKARDIGLKVIQNSNFALAPKFENNFTPGNQENNTEILFAVWSKQGVGDVPITIYFTPRAWQGWGFHHPAQNFVSEFEANDVRQAATVLSVGDSIPNQTTLIDITDKDAYQMFTGKVGEKTGRMLPSNALTTGYCIRKFTAYNADGSGNIDSNLKQPILRTADIYLVVAEAKIRLTGAGAGDAEINAVRKRTGLAPVSNAGIKQLIHERRVELGGENNRFFDLLRWDKAGLLKVDTIFRKPKSASPLPPFNGAVVVPGRTFTRPKNYYMPIPQIVIDQSKGVLKQNPNY